MCFELDSQPPVPTIAGAAVANETVTLTAADGNQFAAFLATAEGAPTDVAVVVLPDVRGLYRFYEELALRFAERGFDSIAIDYFGRSAGVGQRDAEFPFRDHMAHTTYEGVRADVAAAVARMREGKPDRQVFTVGFCFGGSNAWHSAADGHGLAGAMGFYGHPNREFPAGATPMIERVSEIDAPVLGLMGGADQGIPEEEVQRFRDALHAAGKPHEIVTYEGAPHSFFDRSYEEHAEASADAWERVLGFIEQHSKGTQS
ncbi:MAG: dienelactone hydrolase family protein [Dehalococcoidia bacterium]